MVLKESDFQNGLQENLEYAKEIKNQMKERSPRTGFDRNGFFYKKKLLRSTKTMKSNKYFDVGEKVIFFSHLKILYNYFF